MDSFGESNGLIIQFDLSVRRRRSDSQEVPHYHCLVTMAAPRGIFGPSSLGGATNEFKRPPLPPPIRIRLDREAGDGEMEPDRTMHFQQG